MMIRRGDGAVFLGGRIEEDAYDELARELLDPTIVAPDGRIHLDTTEIARISSTGLRHLFMTICRGNCPPITHTRMGYEFLNKLQFVSMLRECDSVEVVRVRVSSDANAFRFLDLVFGVDVPILEDYAEFDISVDVDGETFVLDDLAQDLFQPLLVVTKPRAS